MTIPQPEPAPKPEPPDPEATRMRQGNEISGEVEADRIDGPEVGADRESAELQAHHAKGAGP